MHFKTKYNSFFSQLIVGVVIIHTLFSCDKAVDSNHIFFCNAENIDDNYFLTDTDSLFCTGAKHQTDRHAHSGKYGVLSSKSNPYIMTTEIDKMVVDGHYHAEIWRYGNDQNGKLIVQGENFWFGEGVAIEKDSLGWEKLVLDFFLPPNAQGKTFKVSFWNSGNDEIVVDDFSLDYLEPAFPAYQEEYLRLEIDDIEQLKTIRKKAFDDKMLITTKNSYVRAIVHFGDKAMPASVRLKGDWLDHIQGKKWSFRIKLDKGFSWRGMRTFNIQTPEARSFLKEWVAHKIAEKEDVLTTRYEFVPVMLNGENLGIYAYEEHFDKQLLENKKRSEGPIIKFSEDHLWRARREKLNDFPFFESAPIVPFKKNKTMKSSSLAKDFDLAQNQLNAFRNCSAAIDEMFDVEKTAKFLAFTDLIEGQHGLIWHNLRFYFNPVSSKLEPIAYDLYSDDAFSYLDRTLIGNFDPLMIDEFYSSRTSFYHLFSDSIFTSKYIFYVEKYANQAFLNEQLASMDSVLNKNEGLLKQEFENFHFDRKKLVGQQRLMRQKLPELKLKIQENYSAVLKDKRPKFHESKVAEIPVKLLPFFFHIYLSDKGYDLVNYFPNDFRILGYLDKNNQGVLWEDPLKIEKYQAKPSYNTLEIPQLSKKKIMRLIIEKNTVQDTISVEIFPWKKPANLTQ